MVKVKIGAITKEITEGALKWYLMAGWKVIEKKKEKTVNNESDSKETVTSQSNI